MPASNADLLTQATINSRPTPTTVSTIRAGGGTTLTCLALNGWPVASKVHFITYRITPAGAKIAGSQNDWSGIVSGTTITGLVLKAGSDTGSSIGDVVEASPTAAYANDLYSWGTGHADTTGLLIPAAVRTALNQTASTGAGWTTLGSTPNTVTYNGNRSYTCVFNSTDLTGTVSNGMRLLIQRTVAAPTKSTSLNGTNQYWNNTSPAGMTFTDNFTCMGWIKLSSYAQGGIISRYDGSNGWMLYVTSTGQLRIQALSGGGGTTNRAYDSYQSIPLNKWVHVAASLNLAGTAGATYIDGVLVPGFYSTATGTAGLTQAGNLNVGAFNSVNFFPGKIAQTAVFSAVLSLATIQSYISQGLAGTETSLISAYSFNGNANDLNANANNLTSQGGSAATNTDSPFAQGATAGSLEYGIITSNAFSTNTTLTVQVPEGSAIPTTGGVSAVSYASVKVPYGFPANDDKWGIIYIAGSGVSTTSATYVQLTGAQITPPVGPWNLIVQWSYQHTNQDSYTGLSTSTSSVSNTRLVSRNFSSTAATHLGTVSLQDDVNLVAATTYYLIGKCPSGTLSLRALDSTDSVSASVTAKFLYL